MQDKDTGQERAAVAPRHETYCRASSMPRPYILQTAAAELLGAHKGPRTLIDDPESRPVVLQIERVTYVLQQATSYYARTVKRGMKE
jgi:hypothetical protein